MSAHCVKTYQKKVSKGNYAWMIKENTVQQILPNWVSASMNI